MHPALSVIIFTTTSGAGYGLLVWYGSISAFSEAAGGRVVALVVLPLALLLITRAPVFDLSPWPTRARLAGFLAMAHVMALARRCLLFHHLCSCRAAHADLARLACARAYCCRAWPSYRLRFTGDDLLYGDDLCLAEDGAPVV